MSSIPKKIDVVRGGLGVVVRGQKGRWYGVMPPTRTRGDITTFSHKSQRRLREALALARPVDCKREPYGICLTIPGDVLSDDKTRSLFKHFICNEVFCHCRQIPIIWRVELQERKQAHWHLIAWMLPNSAEWFNLRDCWARGVKKFVRMDLRLYRAFERYGCDCRPLSGSSATGIIGYICDHQSKHKQAQLGWKGRQWGIVNRSALTMDGEPVASVTPDVHRLAARQLRRLQSNLRTKGGHYTGAAVTPSANVSRSIFGRDEERYLRALRFYETQETQG